MLYHCDCESVKKMLRKGTPPSRHLIDSEREADSQSYFIRLTDWQQSLFLTNTAERLTINKVQDCCKVHLMTNQTDQLVRFKAEFFKALASPVRIGVLDELRNGELSVSELRLRLNVEPTNLSQQLAVLRSKNIIVGRKQGSNIFYSCRDPAVFKLLDAAKEIFNNHLVDIKGMLEAL